jgi:hypothetical protein
MFELKEILSNITIYKKIILKGREILLLMELLFSEKEFI